MKQTDPQFKLRIPPALKAQIDQAAAENRRSLNAEIVARLEESFEAKTAQIAALTSDPSDQVIQMLSALQNELAEVKKAMRDLQHMPDLHRQSL